MIRNARFWDRANGGWVKITLRPNQALHHHQHHQTEEGWQYEDTTWMHEGHTIRRTRTDAGLDCDGVLRHHLTDEALIEQLAVDPCWISYKDGHATYSTTMRSPAWVAIHHEVYDQYAQAAGY